jgi:hypothetical protein
VIVLAQFVPSFEVAMADDRPVLPVPVITTVPDDAPPFRLWDPSPSAPTMIQEIEFAPDSPLEQTGFELSVPPRRRALFAEHEVAARYE